MIRIELDEIRNVGPYRIGAVVEKIRAYRVGPVCHAWIAKRPLAVLIVSEEGEMTAFTPDGEGLSLEAVEKLCPGTAFAMLGESPKEP